MALAAAVFMTVLVTVFAACAPAGNRGVATGADDRVMRLSLIFATPPDPWPTLTATFSGYAMATVWLGPPLSWNADQKSIDLDFLLPGLANNRVDITLSVDTPPLFGSANNRLAGSGTISITLTRDPARLHNDGGGDDAGDAGGADADGVDMGVDRGGSGGAGGAADMDGGADEHPIGPVDGGGADTNDGGTGVIECDDGGVDHVTGPAIPTCAQYCATLVNHCGPPYSDNCMNVCGGLHWDSIPIPDQSTARNNLRCRIDQANQAQLSAPDEGATFCAAAIWNGMDSGGCGTPCVVYCDAGKTNCGGETLFTDATACLNTCRAFSRASLNCRVDALVRAGLGMSAAESCTSASQGSGCPP